MSSELSDGKSLAWRYNRCRAGVLLGQQREDCACSNMTHGHKSSGPGVEVTQLLAGAGAARASAGVGGGAGSVA